MTELDDLAAQLQKTVTDLLQEAQGAPTEVNRAAAGLFRALADRLDPPQETPHD